MDALMKYLLKLGVAPDVATQIATQMAAPVLQAPRPSQQDLANRSRILDGGPADSELRRRDVLLRPEIQMPEDNTAVRRREQGFSFMTPERFVQHENNTRAIGAVLQMQLDAEALASDPPGGNKTAYWDALNWYAHHAKTTPTTQKVAEDELQRIDNFNYYAHSFHNGQTPWWLTENGALGLKPKGK